MKFLAPQEIYTGERYVVYRARQSGDERAVVVKRPARGRDDAATASRLRREYELLSALDVPGVVKPLGIQDVDGAPALVLEPAGARDLGERLAQGPIRVSEFLELAVEMAAVVAHVHGRNIVHRDICPAKFVLDEGGRVTLVGFDLAASFDHVLAGEFEGSLAHMAPELTGRMRRAGDHRADLYALGATFYEMLVGTPPFPRSSAAELVHAHLASLPVSPAVMAPAVPILLSDIVLKLLAKMPEERYQSADGLLADLQEARRQWHSAGTMRSFPLAREDLAKGLFIPDRLFGREREWAELAAALQDVRRGGKRLVLVSGRPGVGKSALVERLEECVARDGRFAAGKCDPLRRNAPLAPFVQAFDHAISEILAEPPEARALWQKRLKAALDGDGRQLTDLLPALERLIGAQPEPEALGAAEAENRLFSLLAAFVRELAADRPFVLFLDDLQWADATTLELLQRLTADERLERLMLVAAYRSDAADPGLDGVLRAVRSAGTAITSLEVRPLDHDAVIALLVETTRATPKDAAPIARVILDRTAGNPLFIRRLLHLLWQARLVTYDRRTHAYSWNHARIAEVPVTENVADLLVAGMQRLPEATRRLLESAACIGMRFDLRELAAVTGYRVEDAARALWGALQEGFIVPVDERWLAAAPDEGTEFTTALYRFAHDRVQEAAYALLDDAARQGWHLRIGRALLALPKEVVERRIFEVVDQLNRGPQAVAEAERMQLAELNLVAGRRAKASSAHGPAFEYLVHGVNALAVDAPRTAHALWFELHREAAECAYLSGEHGHSESLIESALAHAATDLERAAVLGIRALAASARGAFAEAVRASRDGLALFDVHIPDENLDTAVKAAFATVKVALAERSARDLLHVPALVDPSGLACLRLLAQGIGAAFSVDPRMFMLFTLRNFTFCLEHGASLYMPRACADYALILAEQGQYALAGEFVSTAIELCARIGTRAEECKVMFVAGVVSRYREPYSASVQLHRAAFARAVATGEFQIAGIAAALRVQTLFAKGARLEAVLGEIEPCQAFIRRVAHKEGHSILVPYRQAVRCLKGHTRSAVSFDDEEFVEAPFLASESRPNLLFYATLRMQVAYLIGDIALASELSDLAERQLAAGTAFVLPSEHLFYMALTYARRADDCAPQDRAGWMAKIAAKQQQLERLAESCPENYRHKALLVAAEMARLEGETLTAARLYEDAQHGAHRAGSLPEEALAKERYGRLCLAHGLLRSGAVLLEAAFDDYTSWGAVLKARALETELAAHGIAIGGRQRAERMPVHVLGAAALDLGSLLEAAEALAAEVALPRLLEKLLRLSLELAGAERGAVAVSGSETPVVRVSGTALDMTLEPKPLSASEALPRTIAEHVLRTSRAVVLSDAAGEGGFGADPYVKEHRVKSVLAVPVRRAARSVGVLYLENNLATDAFTPERVHALELLSGQIGAALDNALLVQQLENEVAERKHEQAMTRFLADVSAALAESLDYEATLGRAARLAVSGLSDICVVDVIEGRQIRPMAVVTSDPAKEPLLREFRRRYPIDWDGPHPAARVLRSGRSLLLSDVSSDVVREHTRDLEHAQVAEPLAVRSMIVVPLIARGRTVGAISLALTRPTRYGRAELALAEEFAQRVALAIDNARLYRQSEDAVRAREEFLSIASHELRTPIASLQLTVDAVTRGVSAKTPQALERAWARVQRQVVRLGQLVEQLLGVSRIQAGRLTLQLEPVDLALVARETIEHLSDAIARSGSRVSLHAPEPVPVGRWDRSALGQVATNLLANAVNFGCGRRITVTVEKVGDLGRLVVEDRGIGIPEERLPHIFERFERAVSAREYGGLGLGLFIARSIVEALGGSIAARSTHGLGSTFTVELPCAGPEERSDA